MADLFSTSSAIISACGQYRYELRRMWNDALPPFVCGMLNPSTADAEFDDATITRVRRRAEAMGYGSLIVWNLGAGRATQPKDWMAMNDPIGPQNDQHIRRVLGECCERGGLAIVGWGNHGSFMQRDRTVLEIAKEIGVALHCLGKTKLGQPKHPLYVSYTASPSLWTSENSRIK